MEANEVYDLIAEVMQQMNPVFVSYREAVQASGFEGPEWGTLAVAHDFEPKTASAARFGIRNPYSNPAVFEERLKTLAEKGVLAPAGDGEYTITDKGHELVQQLGDVLEDTMRATTPLPVADLDRIAGLVFKLIEAMAKIEKPADKRSFFTNRSSDRGPSSPPMLRFLQYVADLGAFRDDSHLSSWRSLGVSGQAWEALTFIWHDEAHTAAELVEKLEQRSHDADAYSAALDELVAQGWVEVVDGSFRLTDAGQTLRDEVEAKTDAYFYGAWTVLSPEELAELGDLLARLRDALEEQAPEPETA
jgi:DNA-binding MarR family transcriptional regulator